MTISFPADLDSTIQRLVDSGRFSDPAEALREAVNLLDERERRRDTLLAALQVGIDQADRGEAVEWTPELWERIRQSARRRAKLGVQPNPDVCP